MYMATWKVTLAEVRDVAQVTWNLVLEFPFLNFLSRGLVTIFSASSSKSKS